MHDIYIKTNHTVKHVPCGRIWNRHLPFTANIHREISTQYPTLHFHFIVQIPTCYGNILMNRVGEIMDTLATKYFHFLKC